MVPLFGLQMLVCYGSTNVFKNYAFYGFVVLNHATQINSLEIRSFPCVFKLNCMIFRYSLNFSTTGIRLTFLITSSKKNLRPNSTNTLICKPPYNKHNDSFFVRSVNTINYLFRHNIINDFSPSSIPKIKKFLRNKPFHFDNFCTYHICCSCPSCKITISII